MTAAISGSIPAQSARTNVHNEFLRVQAETRRIRLEFLQAELTLSYTIACFPKPGDGPCLAETCYWTALKGYNIVRNLLIERHLVGRQQELETRLDQLRAVLANGQPSSQPGPAEAACPETVLIGPANAGPEHSPNHLTPREVEVLKYIAEGRSTKQVAGILGMAFRTAACHRYRIMEKLNIHETAGLVRYAIRQGMIQA